MNKLSKLVCFLLIGSAVIFAGCPKKAHRPDPSQTTNGMGPGGLNPTDVGLGGAGNDQSLQNKPEGQDRFKEENLERGVLPTVYFDFDRSAIKPSERSKLEEASKKIAADYKGKQILLEGHCDWRGTAEYNMGLGDRRANAVKEYLAKLGVEVIRLEPLSKGDLDAKENASGADMNKDRRVEIVVIKQ
jgi:peptidoglycan-associated lipoprotein